MATQAAAATETVKLLTEVAEGDTVFADVYLRRARDLLAPVLARTQHDALKRTQQDIDAAVKRCKAATAQGDWRSVERLAAEVEQLRQQALQGGALRELGAKVYDPVGVPIDPFSPGFESLPGLNRDPAELRDALVASLKTLERSDPELASFYVSRRTHLAGLAIASRREESASAKTRSAAEVQQLAMQAAQRGDIAQLRRYAQELVELEKTQPQKAKSDQPAAPAAAASYRCPVDLAVPLADDVLAKARAVGLAAVRTEPLPQAEPLFAYLAARIWHADFAATASETEGAMRAEAAVDEVGFPTDTVAGIKTLVGQFLRNPFVNSGGARHMPLFNVEAVLVEDFAEDQIPEDAGGLIAALGLPRRRGLARVQIEEALLDKGAAIVAQLGLDARGFRLVCIPQDLYTRVGRDRGWGQRQQWTHFDGYQVLRSGQLRALVGGDVRYGGLTDLVSIGITDQRESVIARFAVIRRARQVARWI